MPEISGERQQLLALECQGRRLLVFNAADVDALFKIDRSSMHRIDGRITRRDTPHARSRIAVTTGARFPGGTIGAVPQRLTVEHGKHPWIGCVVVLHRTQLRRHQLVAGVALTERDLADRCRGGCQHQAGNNKAVGKLHSTASSAVSLCTKPLSPVQRNSSVPLSAATVKNEINGLAAIAGDSSARKISLPLWVQRNSVMMSRGIIVPFVPVRNPLSIGCEISVLISMISPRRALAGTLIRTRAITAPPARRRLRVSRRHRRSLSKTSHRSFRRARRSAANPRA